MGWWEGKNKKEIIKYTSEPVTAMLCCRTVCILIAFLVFLLIGRMECDCLAPAP